MIVKFSEDEAVDNVRDEIADVEIIPTLKQTMILNED